MMRLYFLMISIFIISFTACAQRAEQTTTPKPATAKSQNNNKMDTSKLINETVKKAIDALQAGDKLAFYACFTKDATFSDDGKRLDLKSFFDNAFSHREKFLTIDKVENNGKDIYGSFFAGQWGTFKVFFKFHQNAENKLYKLDIGQAKN